MRAFHVEARRQAVICDKLWYRYVNIGNERVPGLHDRYKDAVELQQMYDRWTERECLVIQTEIAAYKIRKNLAWENVITRIGVPNKSDTLLQDNDVMSP